MSAAPAAPRRLAVVLFNLGGPDEPAAVEPFLRNLFSDPAIISLPALLRRPLARVIARRRARVAREIYQRIGGRSPILDFTRAQAAALAAALAGEAEEVQVFVCMRYWHPMAAETARLARDFAPDRLVLLPLYPQWSTTTSASSLADWHAAAAAAGIAAPWSAVCCWPEQAGLVAAQAALLGPALEAGAAEGPVRLLFSAHGLPRKVIVSGDPYQWQVERTAAAVVRALALPDLDWAICYQSRVGPLEWIGPSTEAEVDRAGRDRVGLVVAPIAFVSDHSETLVELDIEYRARALAAGVPAYRRVPALNTLPEFIGGLADLVRASLRRQGLHSGAGDGAGAEEGGRICPGNWRRCALP